MSMDERAIPAGEFKQKCLALIDQVAATGGGMLVDEQTLLAPTAEIAGWPSDAAP